MALSDCTNCGSETHTHEISPNFAQTNVVVDGQRVIFPRPLRSENICLDKLNNVFVDRDPVDYCENADDHALMAYDTANCDFVPITLPCPTLVDWDVTVDSEPAAGGCVDCVCGQTVYAREVNSNRITHTCVDGVWVPLGGDTSTPDVGDPIDRICYDLSGWTFPTNYSAGCGNWFVYGIDRMTEACTGGTQNFGVSQQSYSCDYTTGSGNGPAAGWASLGYINHPENDGVWDAVPCDDEDRGVWRNNFGLPSQLQGPLVFDFDIETTNTGRIHFAWYDTVSNLNLPFTILSAPAGDVTTDTGPTGPELHVNSSGTPAGSYQISVTLPAGVTANNVRMVGWAWQTQEAVDDGGRIEIADNFEVTGQVPNAVGCRTFQSAAQVATWLNGRDPNGLTWVVNGDIVCAEGPVGVGSAYGNLSTCDESADPDVTTDNSTGGAGSCPNCVTLAENNGTITVTQTAAGNFSFTPVAACDVTLSNGATGTRSGFFVDACDAQDLGGASDPETVFPAADYQRGWRQYFVNSPDGDSVWIVQADAVGNLQWRIT